MGIGGSKRNKEVEKFKPINAQEFKNLLNLSEKKCSLICNKKEENIYLIKEEIISCLNINNLDLAKSKMANLLKEEDYITIYYLILEPLLETLKEKCNYILSNNKCPKELRTPLDTILYAATRLEIDELKQLREIINQKYGSEYISRVDNNTDKLINEVLLEKLTLKDFSEELILVRLKLLCEEKKITYKFPDDITPKISEFKKSQTLRNNIYESQTSKLPIKKISQSIKLPDKKQLYSSFNSEAEQNNLQNNELIDNDKYLDIIKKGESIFLPNDENIDKKCYSINNIENWANSFYNLKSGIILEKYKEIVSKSENSKFFEALNYEYGINNYPLDTNKAFQIYKKAADTSTDALSMYRLYHIYKKDFKKFNIKERNNILEKFYILKCFTYSTQNEKLSELFHRFVVWKEIKAILLLDDKISPWYYEFFKFLYENYKIYNLNKDDIILIEVVIYHYYQMYFTKEIEENIYDKIFKLSDEEKPEAMYNLVLFKFENEDEKQEICEKNYKKLYKMNYYRSFGDYANYLPYGKEALTILKKSILNGYYGHIGYYSQVFFKINEIDDIFKSSELKSELMFILRVIIDNIIVDEIEILFNYIYLRKIAIKHYNFDDEFKVYIDPIFKEVMNYLNKFIAGTDEENKALILSYYECNYYRLLYNLFGLIYYYGMNRIIERNYDKSLNIFNYLLKNDDTFYDDRFCYSYIYVIKSKQRQKYINSNENNNKIGDKELIKLQKNLLNMYYSDLTVDTVKKYPPSYFYSLSRLYRNNSINNEDIILEYVFLNRAANAQLLKLNDLDYQMFDEKYFIYKAKKKVAEKNKDENFKKIRNAKGAINVEGYGEDGTICPICLYNKKSIICLPCKHFFCKVCMDRLLDKGICPICRIEIKITFDFDLKKEKLIKTILINSYNSFAD